MGGVTVGVVAAVGVEAVGGVTVGVVPGVVDAETAPRHVDPALPPIWTFAGGAVGKGIGNENKAMLKLAPVKRPPIPSRPVLVQRGP